METRSPSATLSATLPRTGDGRADGVADAHGRPVEADILRCPDCGGRVGPDHRCVGCGRGFLPDRGVTDLLPSTMEAVKLNEDTVFADGSPDLLKVQGRPWRSILGRKEIERFDREIVDTFRCGRFLELGGETCWASAVYKSVHPDGIAYGSDVSPNSLRNAAAPAVRLFPRQPDFLVALDAEAIPFADATFDAVFATTMMHHLPHPSRMLDEVARVLKPGGRFVAIDAAVPAHFRWLFARIAAERAAENEIQEELHSWDRWRRIVAASALPEASLTVYTNPAYQYNPLYAIAGRLVDRLPKRWARAVAPVGIVIAYDKPA